MSESRHAFWEHELPPYRQGVTAEVHASVDPECTWLYIWARRGKAQ
jgi:hypothetical protein